MTMRRIFDAHHHLWKLDHCRYPWLMAKGVKRFFGDPSPIQKDYLVTDFRRDAEPFSLVGSTHVQVGVEEDDAVRETRWLQSRADEEGLPGAIVGFADLTADDVEAVLSAHAQAPLFRGVRQIIGRHPSEDDKSGTGALVDDPRFLRGLKALSRDGLSFDLQLTPAQYDGTAKLFHQLPDLKLAICHFASPWDPSPEGFRTWRRAMSEFARLPRASLKFSGFGMFKPDWRVADIEPYVDTGLELFGDNRCMAGSNFPVDKLYGGYERIWRALDELVADDAAREKITLTNAARFYGVSLTDRSKA